MEAPVHYAMLFPGQGSQAVGMGRDLVQGFVEAERVFAEADELLGFSLSALCFEGPQDVLTETHNAQPALLVHSVAVLRVLEARGVMPSVVAGHSLGEYSALVAAGALDFSDAVRIVRKRGELMFDSGVRTPGTMAAVMGLDIDAIESVCAQVRELGVCDVANLNTPDQIVISGSIPAIEAALPRLEAAGAGRVQRLNVGGAFHSALMQVAASELGIFLDAFVLRDARLPVVANVTAHPEKSRAQFRLLLQKQITAPVRWVESMRALRKLDSGPILEVGAGAVLRGLMRRIDRGALCSAVGDRASVEALMTKRATA